MSIAKPTFITTPAGSRIACYKVGRGAPEVFAVGGLSEFPITDLALGQALEACGASCLSMDLAVCGNSRLEGDLTMDVWLADVEYVFGNELGRPAIWVATSMGAWLALLVQRARRADWFKAMFALAPALDWDTQFIAPGLHSGSLVRSKGLVMEGARPVAPLCLVDSMKGHHILDTPFELHAPLHVMAGGRDPVLSAEAVERFVRDARGAPCSLDLFPGADHAISKLVGVEPRRRFDNWLAAALAAHGREPPSGRPQDR